MALATRLSITGFGALSALGESFDEHLARIDRGETSFQPLAGLLGNDSPHARLPAAWIANRKLLTHRKWSPASMAALHAAREALRAAAWSEGERRDAVVFLGTSRGTAAGWIDPWPQRRAFPLMAASNSLHSEPAAAVSIELGIQGPWQALSSGCAAGLDALGMAALWLHSGMAQRALVVAVDLPLSPALLDSYAATGILSTTGANDPYGPTAAGILPAEAAVALTLENRPAEGAPLLTGYVANADAADAIGMPPGAPQLVKLLREAGEHFGQPDVLCPHASGTASHSRAEPAAIQEAFQKTPALCLLKPFTGHAIGAGGLLEAALLAGCLQRRRLPLPLKAITCPPRFSMTPGELPPGAVAFKLASALGGKNSLIALQAP